MRTTFLRPEAIVTKQVLLVPSTLTLPVADARVPDVPYAYTVPAGQFAVFAGHANCGSQYKFMEEVQPDSESSAVLTRVAPEKPAYPAS